MYYLDDDNIIDPNLNKLLDKKHNNNIYTFNQYDRIKDNNINVGYIDTAMVILPFSLCKNINGNWKCMKQMDIILKNVLIIIEINAHI